MLLFQQTERLKTERYKEHLPTCYHIWILPFHYVHYSVTDHLVQRNGYLVEKTTEKDIKFLSTFLFLISLSHHIDTMTKVIG